MSLSRGKIHQPTFTNKVQPTTIGQQVAINVWTDSLLNFLGKTAQGFDINLDIEVPRVTEDSPIFHLQEMLFANDSSITGEGNKELPFPRRLTHEHDAES